MPFSMKNEASPTVTIGFPVRGSGDATKSVRAKTISFELMSELP
ncbi:MAG: hypothetical protein Q4E01_07525 [Actinomycetaceae bacterium]|nr:hypothetical protein [Actinomycetaceae bacterium]